MLLPVPIRRLITAASTTVSSERRLLLIRVEIDNELLPRVSSESPCVASEEWAGEGNDIMISPLPPIAVHTVLPWDRNRDIASHLVQTTDVTNIHALSSFAKLSHAFTTGVWYGWQWSCFLFPNLPH